MKILMSVLAVILLSVPVYAQVESERTIALTWIDNSPDEDGFIVYLKKGDGVYEVIGKTGPNVTRLEVKVMSPEGKHWCFAAASFSKIGESVRSGDVCVIIPVVPVPPNAPSGLQAEVLSPTSAKLEWQNPNDTPVSIFRAAMQGSGSSAEFVLAGGREYVDGNLRKNTSYCYLLTALPENDSNPLETSCVRTPNR